MVTYSNCTCNISRFFSVIHPNKEYDKSSNIPGNATKKEANHKPGKTMIFLNYQHVGNECREMGCHNINLQEPTHANATARKTGFLKRSSLKNGITLNYNQ